jgi:hypothetical protein
VAIPIGKPSPKWQSWCWDSKLSGDPFAAPLLACTHVPEGCQCCWAWLARAGALARKYKNESCNSRHDGAWLVP